MTVQEITDQLNLDVFHMGDAGRVVTGGYCGDLLSWVMGRAPADGAWMTIMSNLNVAAVASLTDVSCVILTEGVHPDLPLQEKARVQGINLLGSASSTYECAAALSKILGEH